MMRRFLSILLVAVMAVTSLDMTVYAVETKYDETVSTQEADLNDEVGQTQETNILEETEIVVGTDEL